MKEDLEFDVQTPQVGVLTCPSEMVRNLTDGWCIQIGSLAPLVSFLLLQRRLAPMLIGPTVPARR